MFRIGEFSRLAQVTIRTLRHYDELGLLKPVHIDRFTDYRYYAIEQLPRLNRILALKDLGLSLDQIGHLLHEDVSPDRLRAMLAIKQAEIERQVQEEQMRLRRIEARLHQIEQEGKVSEYEMVLKHTEPMTIVSMRQVVPALAAMKQYRCSMLAELYDWLADQRVQSAPSELILYYNKEYVEQEIDMEVALRIEKTVFGSIIPSPSEAIHVRELPAIEIMASVVHRGDIYRIGQAMTALFIWIGENGYVANGPYRELHHSWREDDEQIDFNDIIVEIQIPVARR